MRKLVWVGLVGFAVVSLAAAAGKSSPTVTVSRYSEAVRSVPSGTQVTISGAGYKRDGQLAVCIDGGNGCTYPRADQDGAFFDGRTLYGEGTRLIEVFEVAPGWSAYRLKARTTCTVTQ